MTHFTLKMLDISNTEIDQNYWRKEAIRCGAIDEPRTLHDEELELWLSQSDYANQFI